MKTLNKNAYYYLSMYINYKNCILMAPAVENCVRLNAEYNEMMNGKKGFVILHDICNSRSYWIQNVRQIIKTFCSFTFRHSCGYFHLNEILLIFEWTWRFNWIAYFCFHLCRRFFFFLWAIHFKLHTKWDPDYTYYVMVQFVIFPIPSNFIHEHYAVCIWKLQ